MAKHVLLGSSYVSRLERAFANNLKIPGHVFFIGKGGMKTDNIPTEFLTSIKRIQPDCVFVHLGGNDITSDSYPKDIATRLLCLYDDLLKSSVKYVFVAEIIPRRPSQRHCPGLTHAEFETQRKRVNCYLKKKIGQRLVRFKQITFPKDYDNDEIHLSTTAQSGRCGLEKYFFRIRRVLLSVCVTR